MAGDLQGGVALTRLTEAGIRRRVLSALVAALDGSGTRLTCWWICAYLYFVRDLLPAGNGLADVSYQDFALTVERDLSYLVDAGELSLERRCYAAGTAPACCGMQALVNDLVQFLPRRNVPRMAGYLRVYAALRDWRSAPASAGSPLARLEQTDSSLPWTTVSASMLQGMAQVLMRRFPGFGELAVRHLAGGAHG